MKRNCLPPGFAMPHRTTAAAAIAAAATAITAVPPRRRVHPKPPVLHHRRRDSPGLGFINCQAASIDSLPLNCGDRLLYLLPADIPTKPTRESPVSRSVTTLAIQPPAVATVLQILAGGLNADSYVKFIVM